jgi:hypothetical protein
MQEESTDTQVPATMDHWIALKVTLADGYPLCSTKKAPEKGLKNICSI